MSASIDIPPVLPAMVLPECTLFPHGLLPLYLFEERYRRLAKDCLEGDRMFFVAMRRDPADDEISLASVHRHATVGLLESCVENDDGTFHLVLRGLQRIMIAGLDRVEPYPRFQVRTFPPEVVDESHQSLALEAIKLARKIDGGSNQSLMNLTQQLLEVEDPEITSDVLANHLLLKPEDQQAYLGLGSRSERLERVLTELRTVYEVEP